MDQLLGSPLFPNADDREAWMTYWHERDQSWRTEPQIDEKRQAKLTTYRAIVVDIKKGIYPFSGIKLTRADIEWLLATHNNGHGPVIWNYEDRSRGKGLNLSGADLRSADLQGLPLTSMCAGLNRSTYVEASLQERRMAMVHLEGANLSYAHLEGADLIMARLEGANLFKAHLEDADLFKAHLEDASLKKAYLGGASLRGAFLDVATEFDDVKLEDSRLGCVRLADIHWGDTNLSRAGWSEIKILGDEIEARRPTRWDGKVKNEDERLQYYQWAVRANRQLSTALQAQGLNEEASHFAYRAQVLRRTVAWKRRKIDQYVFLVFLGLLAGYGYRLLRSLVTYMVIVGAFALAYYLLGAGVGINNPLEALVFSVTSFHGRGYFPGTDIRLSHPAVVLAAIEAFVGLFIEVTLIATLSQRLFRK